MKSKRTSPNKGKQLQKDFPLFRERLELRRKELGLTREQLAKEAGVSASILNKWINGAIDKDTFDPLFHDRFEQMRKERNENMEVLAKEIGVTVSVLAKWIDGTVNESCFPSPDRLVMTAYNLGLKDKDIYKVQYTPPSLDKLSKVARVLGVSLDYFFNPAMNCLTVTNQKIHDITGLTDESIEKLMFCYGKGGNAFMGGVIDITNRLLSTDDGWKLLLLLHNYLYGNFTYFDDKKRTVLCYNEAVGVKEKLCAKEMNALNLLRIQELLVKMRTGEHPPD